MKKIIEVNNVCKVYLSKENRYMALNKVSFNVDAGEFVVIMGPSGAGKTTLLNVISTIDLPTSGEIFFAGRDICKLKQSELAEFRRRNIGFIFQEFNLLDNMSVRDNIALPLVLNGIQPKEIIRKVDELSVLLGISEQLEKYPYQISGGQKQRASIARALVMSPAVLFADEPTGALDSKTSMEILGSFRDIVNKFKTTIIMVTHDPLVASFSDRILFLKDGGLEKSLISRGKREETYNNILNTLAEKEVHKG